MPHQLRMVSASRSMRPASACPSDLDQLGIADQGRLSLAPEAEHLASIVQLGLGDDGTHQPCHLETSRVPQTPVLFNVCGIRKLLESQRQHRRKGLNRTVPGNRIGAGEILPQPLRDATQNCLEVIAERLKAFVEGAVRHAL